MSDFKGTNTLKALRILEIKLNCLIAMMLEEGRFQQEAHIKSGDCYPRIGKIQQSKWDTAKLLIDRENESKKEQE